MPIDVLAGRPTTVAPEKLIVPVKFLPSNAVVFNLPPSAPDGSKETVVNVARSVPQTSSEFPGIG